MAGKIRVLMVDDEEQFRSTTSKILTRKGYETTMAASGEEAIEALKKARQDVVILDMKMPGMDGNQTLLEIRKIDPDLPVIMLTGHGTMDSAKKSLKGGAFDYLSKPCDIDLLASKINDAYEAAQKGFNEKEEKKAGDIMIPIAEYTRISVDSTVREAIEALGRSYESFLSTGKVMECGHRSILVFDRRERLSGILSILDLIKALRPAYLTAPKPSMADTLRYSTMFWSGLFTSQAKGLVGKKVSDIMSEPPLTIEEDANLMEIAEMMVTEKARRLGVTRGGKVVGVVREQELFFEIARIVSRPS
ncbi:MAG: response regulator [Desulfobacteraceae bacterium]|nr:MAG: response regulator [Desulfobacteraceae bacterium]